MSNSFNYIISYGGGIGPDVWDKEMEISAVDIQDAIAQANGRIEESGGWIFMVSQEDYPISTREKLESELSALRAESIKLISANDEMERERDGLREERDKAREGEQAITKQKAQFFAEFERLRTEAATAQAAEARLRALLVIVREDTLSGSGKLSTETRARIDTALSTPPTAALPDGRDGEELLDWLEANHRDVFTYGVNHWTVNRDSDGKVFDAPSLRAAIRAATGATP